MAKVLWSAAISKPRGDLRPFFGGMSELIGALGEPHRGFIERGSALGMPGPAPESAATRRLRVAECLCVRPGSATARPQ